MSCLIRISCSRKRKGSVATALILHKLYTCSKDFNKPSRVIVDRSANTP